MDQRTSGEVINATLMELFVALVFMVMAVHLTNASENDAIAARMVECQEANKTCIHELDGQKHDHEECGIARDEANRQKENLAAERDDANRRMGDCQEEYKSLSEKYQSAFPDYCRIGGDEKPVIARATLLSGGGINVEMIVNREGYRAGEKLTFANPAAFKAGMRRIYDESQRRSPKCKYRVTISDQTGLAEKVAYQQGAAAVRAYFYW